MVPFSADVSLDQPSQEDIVICPDLGGKYQCRICSKYFPCHEPYQHHVTKHGEAIKHIYTKSRQLNPTKSDIRAYHGVYCHRGIHYVRVTISEFFGSTSSIRKIDEEDVLTFGDFHEKKFNSTEIYNYTLERMEEFDSRCCRRIPNTTVFSPKNILKLLRSCFACIPTPRWLRPRHWPSIPDPRATSLYPSTEATTTNNAHLLVTDDLISIESQPVSWKSLGHRQDSARPAYSYPSSPTVPQTALVEATPTYAATGQLRISPPFQATNFLPESVTGIVAVGSFCSTSNGVRGHKVLVATWSDTVMLLQQVDLDALLSHERLMNQLQDIVGEQAFGELLKFQDKCMDILEPVYRGILPDDLPIRVGEELSLEKCSPMLLAHVNNCIHI